MGRMGPMGVAATVKLKPWLVPLGGSLERLNLTVAVAPMGPIAPMAPIPIHPISQSKIPLSFASPKCNNERLGKPERRVVSSPAFYVQRTLPQTERASRQFLGS